jgi:hypothetical protein
MSIKMAGLSKNRKRLHQAASIAIVAIYLFVTASVDLFHTEAYMFCDQHSGTDNSISSNSPCPACAFLAGHHSTGANHAPALLNIERLYATQSLPLLTIVCIHEWASSITSRAPPSITLT